MVAKAVVCRRTNSGMTQSTSNHETTLTDSVTVAGAAATTFQLSRPCKRELSGPSLMNTRARSSPLSEPVSRTTSGLVQYEAYRQAMPATDRIYSNPLLLPERSEPLD